MYKNFAYIYDKMMEDVDYEEWANYIEKIFAHNNIKPKDIVDLACGTGNMTTIMAQRGYNMIGIDNAQDMLSVAQEKARKMGLKIPFIEQDMREIFLHKKVDAVLVVCDGINYILKDLELDKVFMGIHRILKPNGLLLFDISSYYKLSATLGNNIFVDNNPDVSYIWQNTFDSDKGLCTMDLTFFVSQGSFYNRFDEIHIQKAHHDIDILERLKHNKFTIINHYEHLRFSPPDTKSQRHFFVAQKSV